MSRLVFFSWLLLCLGGALSWAQSSALEPREAQFVFVIDDSGSMSQEEYGRMDPDRLAIFAVRSLLSVLDDRDWASVIRMNGPFEGEQPPPLAPLTPEHRQRIEDVLDLGGKLARYSGQNTPCRSALQAANYLLDGADRADVSQVVLFLSDGECNPSSEQKVLDLVDGLGSHREGGDRFQFYLLRFQGTEPSGGLERLAEMTGGAAIELRRGDPTRILHTFAQALSRSQGYESQILSLGNPDLPAHRGARRVRLLAVARGGGEPLDIIVKGQGGSPVAVESMVSGEHHFVPDGHKYRYATVQYRPIGEAVQVAVHGAGNDWEMVALPEYRLNVEMQLQRGQCGESSEVVRSGKIAAGVDLCAVVRLVNDRAQPVGPGVTGGKLEGVIELRSPGVNEPQRITTTPRKASEASFELDLPGMVEGRYSLRATVELTPPGDSRPRILSAGLRNVTAVDQAIHAKPTELSFGDIFPGFDETRTLSLKGAFAETEALVQLADPDEVPPCVRLEFAGKALGDGVTIRASQGYPLRLQVAQDCAEHAVEPLSTQLLVRLPELPGSDVVTLPLTWRLNSTVLVEDAVTLDLAARSAGIVEIAGSDSEAATTYEVSVEPLTDEDGELASNLRIGFLDEHSAAPMRLDAAGDVLRQIQTEFAAGAPLAVRVEARPCCATGVYRGRLFLRPVDGGQSRAVPLLVNVQGGWWVCYGSWVIAAALGFIAALLAFYIMSMFRHSHFLSRRQLVARLVPLHWPRYGGSPQPAPDRGADREEVEDMIGEGLKWHQRVWNWLRANPLIFGLPGRSYHETIELFLAPELSQSSVALIGERDVVGRFRSTAEIDPWEEGRVFAHAGSGVMFKAIRGPKGEICQLAAEGWFGNSQELKIEPLRAGQRLIHKISERDRREGLTAGWVLG